jgi:hypothetical protein
MKRESTNIRKQERYKGELKERNEGDDEKCRN